MGKEKLPLEEYKRIRAKIEKKQKLSRQELHDFSKDHLERQTAKISLRNKYAPGDIDSFGRIGFAYFDENELEEYNPDPVSREAARKNNAAIAARLKSPQERAKLSMEFMNRMMGKSLDEIIAPTMEDALYNNITNPVDALLCFDPSHLMSAKPTKEMVNLFKEFDTVFQYAGDGKIYLDKAKHDWYPKLDTLPGQTSAEIFPKIAEIKDGREQAEAMDVFGMVTTSEDALKRSVITGKLREMGFKGQTFGELLTMKFSDEQGKSLSVSDAFSSIVKNKPVNMQQKSLHEIDEMLNTFDNAYQDKSVESKGIIQIPEMVEPAKPSFFDKFMAFFGNKKAKEKISHYEVYNRRAKDLEENRKLKEAEAQKAKETQEGPEPEKVKTEPEKTVEKVKGNPEKEASMSRLTAACETLKNPEANLGDKVDAVKDMIASALIESGKYKESDREALKNSMKDSKEIEGFVNNRQALDEALNGFQPDKPGSALKVMDKVSAKLGKSAQKKEAEPQTRQRQLGVEKVNEKSI